MLVKLFEYIINKLIGDDDVEKHSQTFEREEEDESNSNHN